MNADVAVLLWAKRGGRLHGWAWPTVEVSLKSPPEVMLGDQDCGTES